MEMVRGLEGVARQGGTAAVLDKLVAEINRKRGSAVGNIGSGQTYFTIFGKTGTLDADGKEGNLLDGAIYFEQGTQGQAQKFAYDLIRALDKLDRFKWSDPQR